MANVTVKLFGVLRVDTGLGAMEVKADTIDGIFVSLNKEIEKIYKERVIDDPSLERPDKIQYKDALIYINETRCKRKKTPLFDGDEVWLLSPASGG